MYIDRGFSINLIGLLITWFRKGTANGTRQLTLVSLKLVISALYLRELYALLVLGYLS